MLHDWGLTRSQYRALPWWERREMWLWWGWRNQRQHAMYELSRMNQKWQT